jgi:hypothetical protein
MSWLSFFAGSVGFLLGFLVCFRVCFRGSVLRCWGGESPGTRAVFIAKISLSHSLEVHCELQQLGCVQYS